MKAARLLIVIAALLGISACATAAGTEDPRLILTPDCADPGDRVTLTVHTHPGRPVLFTTQYSDGNSGAPEPLGEGYGGNDGGFADEDGVYRSSWIVANDAPAGPVTVEAVLPWRDHDHGHDHSEHEEVPELHGTFEVGDGPRGC